MIKFLLKIWGMTRPYKLRMILGIITGFLSGIADALVLVTAALVMTVVFPTVHDEKMDSYIHQLPTSFIKYLDTAKQAFINHNSSISLIVVVSLIPLVVAFG